MKKSIVLIALSFLFYSSIYAQTLRIKAGGSVQGITSTYADSAPLLPGFFVELEGSLKNKISMYAKSDLLFKTSLVVNDVKEKISSYGFSSGLRFYTKDNLQGFFIGPEFSYSSFNEKLKGDEAAIGLPQLRFPDSILTFGLNLGFRKMVKDNISFGIQTSFGLGYSSEVDEAVGRIGFAAGAGYSF